jgi:hypothetical protein
MRKVLVFAICAGLGALLFINVSESDWLMAGVLGTAMGLMLALFFFVYPKDMAPPADRRYEAQRKRAA